MPSDIKQAQRMMDLFCSVGARSFVVTKLDIEQKLIWAKTYSAAELRDKLPAMVRTAEIRRPHRMASGETVMAGENLIIRPVNHFAGVGKEIALIQLDDLDAAALGRVQSAAFLTIATSPGNHQAWVAVESVAKTQSKEFIRRVRAAVGETDKSASGASRIAGVENWKVKNLPEPPIVSIVCGVPGRVMAPERLQEMRLLAEPAPIKAITHIPPRVSANSERQWPNYEKALAGAPPNTEGTGPSRSHADYWWAYLAQQWGHGAEETTAKLMEVSENAQQRAARGDKGYARITVENAAAAAAKNSGRNRG